MSRKVHIVGGGRDGGLYESMFEAHGWQVVNDIAKADLVQFTGGADVGPELYGEAKHPRSQVWPEADIRDRKAVQQASDLGIPMAGICRGGQFLNVMHGGKLYQHVDNHAIGVTHEVNVVGTDKVVQCTSTHHQMMRPGIHGNVLGTASLSTYCEHMMECGNIMVVEPEPDTDVEVVLYKDSRALCFQPHPEYMGVDSPCQKWYFALIEELL